MKIRVVEVVFFIAIFLLSIVPLTDFDIWFHLKSGEVFLQKGIIFYDVFSHSASGRAWFPYEWLFQVTVFLVKQWFGFEAIKFLIAAVVTGQLLIFYYLLRKLLSLKPLLSLVVCFFFFASIFEFISARPHIFAYTFLIANLALILTYYFKSKNLLWISLPITLAWANLHGSIFLDAALFFGYSFICLVNYLIDKKKEWLSKSKVLGVFGVISAILTILPPLGFTQYKLLWIFFQQREFISRFIDEWAPLSAEPMGLLYYSLITAAIVIPFIIIVWKRKSWAKNLWVIPLLPFPVLAYVASRNGYLGYISLSIILGWVLANIKFPVKKIYRVVLMTALVVILGFLGWIISQKRISDRSYYPVQATKFIKEQKIAGNMFNDYGFGGYLLYNLYPEQKVFYDGRTDVYLCCEMRDAMQLAVNKNLPDDKFQAVLNQLWEKYHISYVLMNTQKHSVLRKVGRNLEADLNWSLVFWDDNSQLFVKKDGQNDQLIKNYGVKFATPFNKDPYLPASEDQALPEYLKMEEIAPSAKSLNTIGFIHLKRNQVDQAKQEFEEAVRLDPTNESPYMNLAEIAASEGDLVQAVNLYQNALKLAPDRGLIYIRLGQLYLKQGQDISKAKEIWQQGLQKTVDSDAKLKLRELLAS